MDVRFERVAEAVAAMNDFEHLALLSSKQSVRPRACKVVLKPVTFECGAYTPTIDDPTIDDTNNTTTTADAASTHRHQQQELAHSLQQQLLPATVKPEAELVPAVVMPTATAATTAAAAISNSDERSLPRALTPECPSTDDDTYCGTGSGTLGRTAVQRRYSKRSRSRSSSRDDASSRSRSRRYYNGSSSTRWHSSSSPQRRNSLQWH
jgi:hypothetical protein